MPRHFEPETGYFPDSLVFQGLERRGFVMDSRAAVEFGMRGRGLCDLDKCLECGGLH